MWENKLFKILIFFGKYFVKLLSVCAIALFLSFSAEANTKVTFDPREGLNSLSCNKSQVKEFKASLDSYLANLRRHLGEKITKEIEKAQQEAKAEPLNPQGILKESKALSLEVRNKFMGNEPLILYVIGPGDYVPMGASKIFECLDFFTAFRLELSNMQPSMGRASEVLKGWKACTQKHSREVDWFINKIQSCFEGLTKLPSGVKRVSQK